MKKKNKKIKIENINSFSISDVLLQVEARNEKSKTKNKIKGGKSNEHK